MNLDRQLGRACEVSKERKEYDQDVVSELGIKQQSIPEYLQI